MIAPNIIRIATAAIVYTLALSCSAQPVVAYGYVELQGAPLAGVSVHISNADYNAGASVSRPTDQRGGFVLALDGVAPQTPIYIFVTSQNKAHTFPIRSVPASPVAAPVRFLAVDPVITASLLDLPEALTVEQAAALAVNAAETAALAVRTCLWSEEEAAAYVRKCAALMVSRSTLNGVTYDAAFDGIGGALAEGSSLLRESEFLSLRSEAERAAWREQIIAEIGSRPQIMKRAGEQIKAFATQGTRPGEEGRAYLTAIPPDQWPVDWRPSSDAMRRILQRGIEPLQLNERRSATFEIEVRGDLRVDFSVTETDAVKSLLREAVRDASVNEALLIWSLCQDKVVSPALNMGPRNSRVHVRPVLHPSRRPGFRP